MINVFQCLDIIMAIFHQYFMLNYSLSNVYVEIDTPNAVHKIHKSQLAFK